MKNYVIINGVNSNTITGLMINELPPITKPQMRAIQEEIDGRDGDITTNLGYSAYDKTITIGLFGTGYDIDDIVAFFNGEGTIVFSNEDDKYYNFKILNQIDYVSLQKFKSASITFHCQPFKYPLTETPLEIEYSYVSDEGEYLSLNTALGEMKVNLLGNTSQAGTPTPDNPIPVNVVSGDNEVVVCGKNLFVKSSVIDGERYLNDGTISNDSSYCRSPLYMNVNGVNKLTISGSDSSSNGKVIIYDENKNVIDHWSTRNNTITIPNNSYYIRISVEKAYKDTLQVEAGDTATSYSSDSQTYEVDLGELELCKISTYQDKFIRNSGKNLLGLTGGTYSDVGITAVVSNGEIVLNGTATANSFIGIDLLESISIGGTNHIVSLNNATAVSDSNTEVRLIYSGNYDSIKLNVANNTRTLNNSKTYTKLQVRTSSGVSYNNYVIKPQIELGSTATSYEPYGNGDWYLEKHIGKKVFDGSDDEDWVSAGSYQRYTITVSDFTSPSSSSTANILCNKLIATSKNNVAFVDNAISGGDENNHKMFVRIDNTITTVALLRTFLSNNSLLVYYQLSSPTYTKIEGTLKDELEAVWRAYSYKGTTNISQVNNDKAFILNVVAMEEGSNEVQVNNIGNTYAKPLIALEGTGNINIYLDNTQILQANVEDKMNIDIAKLEAYNPDTSVLLNRQVIGNYNSMTLQPGNNTIRIDGALDKATISNYTRWI